MRSISRAPSPGAQARCRATFPRSRASGVRAKDQGPRCEAGGPARRELDGSRCKRDGLSPASAAAARASRYASLSGMLCIDDARGARYGTVWPSDCVRCRW